MRLKVIEQVFWSTVDKLDVIDHISLANFMVGVAAVDVNNVMKLFDRILCSCLTANYMLKLLYKGI